MNIKLDRIGDTIVVSDESEIVSDFIGIEQDDDIIVLARHEIGELIEILTQFKEYK